MVRKIIIDPVTRVEGHGKVTIQLDDDDNVIDTKFHVVEFRGFERFVQGRPYWEVPVLVQRLCGICPVSHHIAAAKAIDVIVGVGPTELTRTGEKMRRLMHYGQIFQSHALHFFYLCSPDLLFNPETVPIEKRNIVGIAQDFPDFAIQGINMRKFGQEIILSTAGKKIHGISAVPGGIHKNLSIIERDKFLKGDNIQNSNQNIDKMIDWAEEAIVFFMEYHKKNKIFIDNMGVFSSNYLGLVRQDGALDFYHGNLRAIDTHGKKILNDVPYDEYTDHIQEEVRDFSYSKFPFLKKYGEKEGWYRVGPLGRLNIIDFIPSPRAQKRFAEYKAYTHGKPNGMSMHMHWARLIETLHAAEVIKELLLDPDLQGEDLIATGKRRNEGIGLIEAPRGTLFHHYRVNDDGAVTKANLIVSTTNNNQAINNAVESVAQKMISGKKEIPEHLLNYIEVVIRAYDPCLSCATHAMGQMPLHVTLIDSKGNILDEVIKN